MDGMVKCDLVGSFLKILARKGALYGSPPSASSQFASGYLGHFPQQKHKQNQIIKR
jgi:hypothetical protein